MVVSVPDAVAAHGSTAVGLSILEPQPCFSLFTFMLSSILAVREEQGQAAGLEGMCSNCLSEADIPLACASQERLTQSL